MLRRTVEWAEVKSWIEFGGSQAEKWKVVFPNGIKEHIFNARYSPKNDCYYTITEDGERIFSTEVIEEIREVKQRKKQQDISKMVEIHPDHATEKAYAIEDGSNGHVAVNVKLYYKYIAKSICVVKDGRIYAPVWAIK